MSLADRLLAVFEGSKAGYGETTVGRIGRKGKAEAKSFIRRGQMTADMVQDHRQQVPLWCVGHRRL